MRIEICGGIASGKTTLARLLSTNKDFITVYENFKSNPFWSIYFSDPVRFYFETEITFFLQHYHAIKLASDESNKIICDYALSQDQAYALIGIGDSKPKMEIFNSIYKITEEEIKPPDVVVYLKCNEVVLKNRIIQRGRKEEEAISIDYISQLISNIEKRLDLLGKGTKIITVNSEVNDFANDIEIQRKIFDYIFTNAKNVQ